MSKSQQSSVLVGMSFCAIVQNEIAITGQIESQEGDQYLTTFNADTPYSRLMSAEELKQFTLFKNQEALAEFENVISNTLPANDDTLEPTLEGFDGAGNSVVAIPVPLDEGAPLDLDVEPPLAG